MPAPFRTYLIQEAVLVAAFNAAINAAYTWYLWRSTEPLTLFGPNGVATDLATTPVVIAVLSTLIGTAIARRKIADGRIAVGPDTSAHPLLHRLPQGVFPRAAVAAALAGLLLALPIRLLLPLGGDGALTLLDAIGMKVVLTILLSLAIVPAVSWAALADAQRSAGRFVIV